jgi:putative membrane protein
MGIAEDNKKEVMPKGIFTIFWKGLLMGTADIIPGISGGTIALITGIYERLIGSISGIDFKFINHVLKGDFKRAWKNIKTIDFALFIPLGSGIVLAMLLMSNLIHYLLKNETAISYAFFFGTILSSAVVVYKKEEKFEIKNLVPVIIGFFVAFSIVGFTSLQIEHSLFNLFLSGIIGICAMILPGISGAAILLLLNQYEYMLFALKNLQLLEICVFSAGALIGILSFSRFVKFLLRKYKPFTMAFLIGLMLGALRLPYLEIMKTMESLLPVLSIGFFSFAIVIVLESKFGK